ncbi:MAG: hypothetical protein L6Q76_04350 [Polyangiaceae bacterium]|nr:hypothetical protein [Polyangiaceae bacterium]
MRSLLRMTVEPEADIVASSRQQALEEQSAMRANLVGFTLKPAKAVTIEEFFEHLSKLRDKTIKFGAFDRLIYVADSDDYYKGLFITVKDQTKFCEIRNEGNEFKILVRSLTDGTSAFDFNVFLLNKITYRGLYLYYHNSCSINQFGLFCRREYEDLRDAKKKAEVDALGTPTTKQRKEIADKYRKTSLELELMVRREKLPSLLDELDRVQVFEFDVATLTADEPTYAPVREYVRRETHKIRFIKQAPKSTISNWISKIVASKNIDRGRVQGKDEEGHTRAFRLMENPDSFGSYEYEEIADESVLNTTDFHNSPLFDEMFNAIEANKSLFLIPSQP